MAGVTHVRLSVVLSEIECETKLPIEMPGIKALKK
jgi:hypothetical protein